MENLIKTTLIGLFFGTFGTTIGGIIGIINKKTSNKFLSFILALASGLMLSIISFDLIPEALEISNIVHIILGILFGIIIMILCDIVVQKKISCKIAKETKKQGLLKTGIIVSIRTSIT